ncbi:MAG: hypothetical protein KME64_07815 [Scytonematopsis contorta HA4267-MV1]|jgi:uncharacterized protein YdeI (BOF family)|nr:hypothetical protein [Scytonematopsis contorta HA4267-MV1]
MSTYEERELHYEESQRRSKGFWDFLVILALVVMGGVAGSRNLLGWGNESAVSIANTSEIVENARDYVGRNVIVRGRVTEQISPKSFTISDEGLFGGEPILVVNANSQPLNVSINRNTTLQITGEVRNFQPSQMQRELNIDLQGKPYRSYVSKPVIVASDMALSPEISQVTRNPKEYYAKRVAITGSVESIYNPRLLKVSQKKWLGGTEDVLVFFKNTPRVAVNSGQKVAVIGEVRPFNITEIEGNDLLSGNTNLKAQLQQDYKDKPVVFAEAE